MTSEILFRFHVVFLSLSAFLPEHGNNAGPVREVLIDLVILTV